MRVVFIHTRALLLQYACVVVVLLHTGRTGASGHAHAIIAVVHRGDSVPTVSAQVRAVLELSAAATVVTVLNCKGIKKKIKKKAKGVKSKAKGVKSKAKIYM